MTNRRTSIPVINVQDVLGLLKQGYTRYEKDNKSFGSIQSHFNMSALAVSKLFKETPALKNKKTISPAFILETGEETEDVISEEEIKDELISQVNDDEKVYL